MNHKQAHFDGLQRSCIPQSADGIMHRLQKLGLWRDVSGGERGGDGGCGEGEEGGD